jgi:hypothetical protein
VTEQHLKAKAGDGKLKTSYPFKNAGSHPVRIITLATSCECTTAELSKEIYAPGEEGELRVGFEVGPQVGPQERTITVTTDEGANATTTLSIAVAIAEIVSVQPKLLFWKVGESADEKKVAVVVADAQSAKLGDVHVRGTDFSVRTTQSEATGRTELWIKPKDTTHAAQTVIRADVLVDGRVQSISIFGAVKP